MAPTMFFSVTSPVRHLYSGQYRICPGGIKIVPRTGIRVRHGVCIDRAQFGQ